MDHPVITYVNEYRPSFPTFYYLLTLRTNMIFNIAILASYCKVSFHILIFFESRAIGRDINFYPESSLTSLCCSTTNLKLEDVQIIGIMW
jgi:hypothetical protein